MSLVNLHRQKLEIEPGPQSAVSLLLLIYMNSQTSLTASVTQWWTWILRASHLSLVSSKAMVTTHNPQYKNKEITRAVAFIILWKA